MRPARLPTALADEPPPLVARLRSLTALGARHRRLVAAVCAGSAVLVTVSTLTPQTPPAAEGTSLRGGASAASGALPVGAGASAPDEAFQVAVAVRLADPAGLLLLRAGDHAEVPASPDETGVPVAGGEAASGGAASGGAGTAGAAAQGEVLARDAVVLGVPERTVAAPAMCRPAGTVGCWARYPDRASASPAAGSRGSSCSR